METSKLRKFASYARKSLIEQVGTRMKSVLAEGSLARRESPKTVAELEAKIEELGQKRTIEVVAYTWFNRFCALRYMDVNRYTKIGIVSPAEGQFQPEILAEAKMGHIDDELVPASTREKVMRLLDETDPSDDPQGEAYRLLLVAVCNYYYGPMPFMFEKIADYTELLLPDDLLSNNSILAYTREALLPINCSPEHTEESVEVIGWLYQFYIADKKDDVFAALKKGKKITPENIPAATQLFTPHWIVRYLVENSLGRLWMLNHPNSRLIERMDYYIKPEEPETDFLKISSPEEIKVCDPACGSGHMLTYAFELLYAIYEEEGYQPTEIPRLILKNNLYGVEIDPRAGALAAFALVMKACEKDRRFFSRKPLDDVSTTVIETPKARIQNPNICVLENIKIDPAALSAYMDKVGRDLFSGGVKGVVNQWEEADNFGSLIIPLVRDVNEELELLRERKMDEDLLLAGVHQKVLKALRQANYLNAKYHVVVANPPYMGSRSMNPQLKKHVGDTFESAKADLFAAFVEMNLRLAIRNGLVGMVTMHSWMFISAFKEFREELLAQSSLISCAHLGPRAFESIGGEVVQAVAFVTSSKQSSDAKCQFIRLTEVGESSQKDAYLRRAAAGEDTSLTFSVDPRVFKDIPGHPIAYWISNPTRDAFNAFVLIEDLADTRLGMATADNSQFVRFWPEVSRKKFKADAKSREEAKNSKCKWFPYAKGGDQRKWYGNLDCVVNWRDDGCAIQSFTDDRGKVRSHNYNLEFIFKPGITWNALASNETSMRLLDCALFDNAGSSLFPRLVSRNGLLGFLNSKLLNHYLPFISPTLNFQPGDISRIPVDKHAIEDRRASEIAIAATRLAKDDWDNQEVSWDFKLSPILASARSNLEQSYIQIRSDWHARTDELAKLESENSRFYIEAYGLSGELNDEVSAEKITLFCNPAYRYGSEKSETEMEALLLADTMREFISYAVGCILGRYSLDKSGLILASQGESVDDYRRQIPEPTLAPDDDNVIPLLDGDWFTDDITERFKEFLRVTFRTEQYEENLTFLENGLYPDNATARKRKTLRDYFLKDFYDHHVKLYKKRPIYWLFSSPKGTFNALIYMHRYRPDTVSTVLQYLRDFRDKLAHRRDHLQAVSDSGSASQADQTKALKEVATLKKQLKELEDYETETLFPLAQQRIEIDLDDGVKHNYPLFGKALKKVTGLSGK